MLSTIKVWINCPSIVAPSMLMATSFSYVLTETLGYNDPTNIHIDSQLGWNNHLFSSQHLCQVLFHTLTSETVIKKFFYSSKVFTVDVKLRTRLVILYSI